MDCETDHSHLQETYIRDLNPEFTHIKSMVSTNSAGAATTTSYNQFRIGALTVPEYPLMSPDFAMHLDLYIAVGTPDPGQYTRMSQLSLGASPHHREKPL
jgi:flagellar basal body rod protein FlgG